MTRDHLAAILRRYLDPADTLDTDSAVDAILAEMAGEWNAGVEAAAQLCETWPIPPLSGMAREIRALRRPDAGPARPSTWQHGDPRCDNCDNGQEKEWVFCPFCGHQTKFEDDYGSEVPARGQCMDEADRMLLSALEAAAAAAAARPVPDARRWRHKKRGSTYIEIGRAKLQTTPPQYFLADYDEMVIYRSETDGSLWCRARDEFEDGRFEAIDAARPVLQAGEVAELVNRLRKLVRAYECTGNADSQTCKDAVAAADLLTAQAAEIERLRSGRAEMNAYLEGKVRELRATKAALAAKDATLREISAEAGVTTSDMAAEMRSKQRIIDLVNSALAPAAKKPEQP